MIYYVVHRSAGGASVVSTHRDYASASKQATEDNDELERKGNYHVVAEVVENPLEN